MIQTILFDFDGTLFDTGEGILRSVQYALCLLYTSDAADD